MELSAHPKRIVQFALFEFTRFMFTKRGIIALIGFTAIWLIALYDFVAKAADIISSPHFADFVKQGFGLAGMSKLLDWPVAEMSIYWMIAAITFPFFTLFVASDQTCSDKQRGTIRFLSLRASRLEIMLGRFFGQLAVVSCLIIITLIAVISMAIYREPSNAMDAMSIAFELFFKLVIAVTPFVGVMTFFNSYLTSSKQAIIHFILFFAVGSILIGLGQHYIGDFVSWLLYIYPTHSFIDVVSLKADIIQSVVTPLVQTSVYLTLALVIMKRKAL